MIKKHLFFRIGLLFICYFPLGLLMFVGKPDRLQGVLYDIENFYGLRPFVLHLFIGGSGLVIIEAIWLIVKRKNKKCLTNFLLLLFFVPLSIYSILNDTFYKEEKLLPTQVNHTTLLVATEGSLYNFDLDINKLAWEYNSPLSSAGNRNSFVLDGQNIFMPFESGSLKNFDVNTGEVIWKQQIYGRHDEGMDVSMDANSNDIVNVGNLEPLFMSKPLIDKQHIVIASHGQPNRTIPFLYSFGKITGQKYWQKQLPTHFNIFAPLKYKGHKFDYYFVNSAVYLAKFGSNTGVKYSYGMFEGDTSHDGNRFKEPLYNQMQTDGKNLFIGDEEGQFYCLPLDENAYIPDADINDPNNTFIKNKSVFKWVYRDEAYDFVDNEITYLKNKTLFAEVKNGRSRQSALIAIDTRNGELKWKKVIPEGVLNWTLIENRIFGNTQNKIFYTDISGQNFVEAEVENEPLSNIELIDSSHIIYVSHNGIEVFDLNTKTAKLVLKRVFNHNQHNNLQIKFIGK